MPEVLVSGAEFHDFEKDPYLVGVYNGEKSVREKDGTEPNQKAGDIMGYVFTTKKGEKTICPANFSVKQAIEKIGTNLPAIVEVTFLGKTALDGGKNFSRMRIQKLTQEEFDAIDSSNKF